MDINPDRSVRTGRDKNEIDDSAAMLEGRESPEKPDSGSLRDLMQPGPQQGQRRPKPPRKERKGFSGWDAAAILFILLLIGGLALWLSGKPNQPAPLNSPVFPTATGMLSPTSKPSPSKTATRVRPTLALPETPTPNALTQAMTLYNKAKGLYEDLRHETNLDTHTKNLNLVREYIDQAIEFRSDEGDYYYLRYEIYSQMASGAVETRAEQTHFFSIALENLEAAVALGTSERWAERDIPLMMFELGECDEGLEALEQIKAEKGASAPPNPSLLNLEALGYNCKGEFEKALKLNEQGLAIDQVEERQWFHAILLYEVGRKGEAMDQLDGLIKNRPDYWGYRYYLRALIHYEMGDTENALADLLVGSYNTWGQCELSCYVQGLMAMDAGEKDVAIEQFQNALRTIPNLYVPAFSRKIENKLVLLGAQPLREEAEFSIQATPMPASQALPTAAPIPTEKNAYGRVVPSDVQSLAMSSFTGNISYSETSYPVFKFIPPDRMKVASVESLSVSLQYFYGSGDTLLKLFLWNPRNGQWVMFTPKWGENPIPDPSRFVDGDGNLYLAVHFQPGNPGVIDDLWIRITLVQQNGSRKTYDGAF